MLKRLYNTVMFESLLVRLMAAKSSCRTLNLKFIRMGIDALRLHKVYGSKSRRVLLPLMSTSPLGCLKTHIRNPNSWIS